jgi:6-phosphofructokinase 1
MVVEVMGRNAGWIALHSGVAGGADVILIPEIPFRIEHVCRKILEREAAGRKFSVVVVAEGARLPEQDAAGASLAPAAHGQVALRVGEEIGRATKKEVRVTVLGHIQRGGSPSPFDRILATRFGCAAADLVAREEFGRMVCLRAGRIESVPLEEAVGGCGLVDLSSDCVRAARSMGISFGDGA